MSRKNIILKEDTRILFNQVKGVIMSYNPEVKKVTDDLIIKEVLSQYMGVSIWEKKTKKKR